jgi:hypothetical protein
MKVFPIKFCIRFMTLAMVAGLFALVCPLSASAATLTVTRFDDPAGAGNCPTDCSLRQAIAAALSGDTILLPSGTYVLTQGELAPTQSVTIAGAGARTTTLLQQSAHSRVLDLNAAGTTVNLAGVTISGGVADNAGTAESAGGGVSVGQDVTANLDADMISGNLAEGTACSVARAEARFSMRGRRWSPTARSRATRRFSPAPPAARMAPCW